MSDERYLDAIHAEAWSEHIYPRAAVDKLAEPPLTGTFARTSRVYERELIKQLDERAAVAQGASKIFEAVSRARDIAYEMLDQLVNPCPERTDVERIVAELDKILGPDLVREADPTGKVLKPLPYDERKRILEAMIDSSPKPEYVEAVRWARELAEARGTGEPPLILVVEDEMGPLLEKARGESE